MRKEQTSHKKEHNTLMCFPLEPVLIRDGEGVPNFMDEPTAALDYSNQVKILKMVRELAKDGYGVLMTSHFPDHAFLVCDKAVLMKEGHVLAFGKPEDVVTGENLTELYGVPVGVSDALIKDRAAQITQKVCVPIMYKEEKNNENERVERQI